MLPTQQAIVPTREGPHPPSEMEDLYRPVTALMNDMEVVNALPESFQAWRTRTSKVFNAYRQATWPTSATKRQPVYKQWMRALTKVSEVC